MPGLFGWNTRKVAEPVAAPLTDETVATSKVLPKVLSVLAQASSPVLMDLGPVIGSNIAFFGEQLACKILVRDLFAEVESYAQARQGGLMPALEQRLKAEPASIDGILCWDLFDYLDRPTGQALAARLAQLLRPGGVLYGFFGTAPAAVSHYTRFTVDANDRLKLKPVPATATTRQVHVNRDINKMFSGLVVAESVLLKSNTRETLFRKP